jgi:KDO2-lipid IV(A) lauroyltransferase
MTVEFAHLDEFSVAGIGPQSRDVITYAPETAERFERVRKGGQAMIGFGAHLANWEIPAVGATLLGVKSALLFRRPGIPAISDLIVKLRAPLMGEMIPTSLEAPVRLARLLQSGVSVGMLADQHYTRGVEVTFFGRRCLANPLIAMLARQTGAPIHGLRVVRNPDGNSFWGEISEEVKPARDADGNFDVAGTMQAVTAVIEGWVREYPEQWLWLHRRWR